MTSAEPEPGLVDLGRLGAYLEVHAPSLGALAGAKKFSGGQSNPTFLIEAAGGEAVLRRKPPGKLLKSAHAVEREYRVQAALADTQVPTARMIRLCEDEAIIGSPFYLMEKVDGRVFWDAALPDVAREERGEIYDAMNRALVDLHAVDPASVGLSEFGRPGNYFARQTERWAKQYQASETKPIAEVDRLIAWLEANVPPDDGRVSIVHGDYRLDNMIFANDAPRLLAIIDWELSTLGHPHADLAYQCMQWRLPTVGAFRGLGDLDRGAHGLPTEEEYVARYCERAGIGEIPHWTFALAFSFFRIAAILQGVYRRALDGNASNPERGAQMGETVPLLGRMALETIEARA